MKVFQVCTVVLFMLGTSSLSAQDHVPPPANANNPVPITANTANAPLPSSITGGQYQSIPNNAQTAGAREPVKPRRPIPSPDNAPIRQSTVAPPPPPVPARTNAPMGQPPANSSSAYQKIPVAPAGTVSPTGLQPSLPKPHYERVPTITQSAASLPTNTARVQAPARAQSAGRLQRLSPPVNAYQKIPVAPAGTVSPTGLQPSLPKPQFERVPTLRPTAPSPAQNSQYIRPLAPANPPRPEVRRTPASQNLNQQAVNSGAIKPAPPAKAQYGAAPPPAQGQSAGAVPRLGSPAVGNRPVNKSQYGSFPQNNSQSAGQVPRVGSTPVTAPAQKGKLTRQSTVRSGLNNRVKAPAPGRVKAKPKIKRKG